jgi:hypothetical protein
MKPLSLLLDRQKFLWITPEQLGSTVCVETYIGEVTIRVPKEFKSGTRLRIPKHGRRLFRWQGDYYVKLLLNDGIDVAGDLWLGHTEAAEGGIHTWGPKRLLRINVPKAAPAGGTLRIKNQGLRPKIPLLAPRVQLRNGDLLLKLHVFDEISSPRMVHVENLEADLLAVESWVYRQMDFIQAKLGRRLSTNPVPAKVIAQCFNSKGWRGIALLLKQHFGLRWQDITFSQDANITNPGLCLTYSKTIFGTTLFRYHIKIRTSFIDNPFAVAAILAHELCHVVVFEWLTPDLVDRMERNLNKAELLEEERLVDLLVFMFGLGQFQVRVSEMTGNTLGYFDQRSFNRMLYIAGKKPMKGGGASARY